MDLLESMRGYVVAVDKGSLSAAAVACGISSTRSSYELPSRQMSVVFLPDRYRSSKLRSFVDFMVEQFPST